MSKHYLGYVYATYIAGGPETGPAHRENWYRFIF
jgi:hypothetical protein